MSEGAHHSPLDIFLGAAPRRARRHFFSIAFLVLAMITSAVLLVRFFAGNESPYYFTLVQAGDITPAVSERGVIHGAREMAIKARFEGTITSVPGPVRGHVRFGQVLAVIDADTIRQTLAIDRADVAVAEASLEAARVTVRETASRLARFESVWRRSGQRVPSFGELEAARADAARARQQEAAALARLRAARLRIADAAERLRRTVVRSPIDGYVVARHVDPGESVHEGQPLFTLAAGFQGMKITVPLSNAQASQLPPGARATVRIEDLPDQAQGARLVRLVSADGRQNAVFELEKAASTVAPGMSATVELRLPARRGVLLVPNAALEFSPESSAGRERDRIYLLSDDGEPRRVYVSTGASDGKRTEIFAQGVEPGARVITGWRNPPTE